MSSSQHYYQRTPDFQLTLTRAMLETLDLRRTLYVILSGITAGDGLDFNRAFLFLTDDQFRVLHGEVAIGPASADDAHRIWEEMEMQRFNLQAIMEHYEHFDHKNHPLTKALRQFTLTLPVRDKQADPFTALLSEVVSQGRCQLYNEQEMTLPFGNFVLRNFAVIPLLIHEKVTGIIVVDNAYNGRLVQAAELDDLKAVANLAALAVERARMHERFKRLATMDGLTGLMNRRCFDEKYPQYFSSAKAAGQALSVVIVDMDNFKDINDRFGHLCGDDLLKEVAKIILSRVYPEDLAVRFGGDEIVLVMPQTELNEAVEWGGNFLEELSAFHLPCGRDAKISASIGVAALDESCQNYNELFMRADKALYQAKSNGRNQIKSY